MTATLERARRLVMGKNAFAYRAFAAELNELSPACYLGIRAGLPRRLRQGDEPTALRAPGRAGPRVGRVRGLSVLPVCPRSSDRAGRSAPQGRRRPRPSQHEQGPARRLGRGADARGNGDGWPRRSRNGSGSVSSSSREACSAPTPSARPWPRSPPRLSRRCKLRIDPNARWKVETAIRIGKSLRELPMEYYEDPVRGQEAMAEVRKATGLKMSTNMCVTRFEHLARGVPGPSDRRACFAISTISAGSPVARRWGRCATRRDGPSASTAIITRA